MSSVLDVFLLALGVSPQASKSPPCIVPTKNWFKLMQIEKPLYKLYNITVLSSDRFSVFIFVFYSVKPGVRFGRNVR